MSASKPETVHEAHVISVDDLAQRWQVNAKTIYAAISDGRIPVLPFKRPYRIAMKVVQILETQGCVDLPR